MAMQYWALFLCVMPTNLSCVAISLFDAALHKPCKQSTTYSHFGDVKVADLAVDGVIDYNDTCTHTIRGDRHPWWQVDLSGIYSVHSVLVRNRDFKGNRLHRFTIRVSSDEDSQGTVCAFHKGRIAVKTAKQVLCDTVISGRFVTISKNTKYLTLCEVQVLVINESSVAISLFDAALKKPCKQSTTYSHFGDVKEAGLAVDGVIDYNDTCTHTIRGDRHPWWQVDLSGIYSVHSVLVRNRDFKGNRLHKFTIRVSSDEDSQGTVCAFHKGRIAVKTAKQVFCDTVISGRFVNISKDTVFLTLCEVQVLVINESRLAIRHQIKNYFDGDFEPMMSGSTLLRCAVHCQLSTSCVMFGYNIGTATCKLYGSTYTSDGNKAEWNFYITVESDAVMDAGILERGRKRKWGKFKGPLRKGK